MMNSARIAELATTPKINPNTALEVAEQHPGLERLRLRGVEPAVLVHWSIVADAAGGFGSAVPAPGVRARS